MISFKKLLKFFDINPRTDTMIDHQLVNSLLRDQANTPEHRKAIAEYNERRNQELRARYPKPMPPPWAEFPEIPPHSMGWRMGTGEDYWHAFWGWFKMLPLNEQEEYRAANPEPRGWDGTYDRMTSEAHK